MLLYTPRSEAHISYRYIYVYLFLFRFSSFTISVLNICSLFFPTYYPIWLQIFSPSSSSFFFNYNYTLVQYLYMHKVFFLDIGCIQVQYIPFIRLYRLISFRFHFWFKQNTLHFIYPKVRIKQTSNSASNSKEIN